MSQIKNGTIVKLTTGCSEWRLGQVVDFHDNQWGGKYSVAMANGEIKEASTISEEGRRGIGWAVASDSDIETHNRLAKKYVNYLESV